VGRPREFDAELGLRQALEQFWRKGYEGASLADLTAAMGITRPTLYSNFGNKEALFLKALDLYQTHVMARFRAALAEPTARAVVERLLIQSADGLADPATPPGCLGTLGALACSQDAEPIKQLLIASRAASEAELRLRLDTAVAAGDLPADADTAALARYVMAINQGMSVQAASGASREDLRAIVPTALAGWPTRA
jgi:AcrR family transcriptional regulator